MWRRRVVWMWMLYSVDENFYCSSLRQNQLVICIITLSSTLNVMIQESTIESPIIIDCDPRIIRVTWLTEIHHFQYSAKPVLLTAFVNKVLCAHELFNNIIMGGRDCDKSNDITIQIIININQKKSLQLERTSRPTRSTEQMRIKSMIETHATSTCSWKALEDTLDYHLHARINSIPLFYYSSKFLGEEVRPCVTPQCVWDAQNRVFCSLSHIRKFTKDSLFVYCWFPKRTDVRHPCMKTKGHETLDRMNRRGAE